MEIELDLPELISKKDHLNVLRYIRVHQIREPELVVEHGRMLLGTNFSGTVSSSNGGDIVRLAILEQICLAAVDCNKIKVAEQCLSQLKASGFVELESIRFRLLLARCLEADNDPNGAEIIYNDLIKDNPSNLIALKRKYCLIKSQPGQQDQAIESLNSYLEQNYSDTCAWYELAKLRMDIGDYKGASFCLEEVMVASPSFAIIHCELAECYATAAATTTTTSTSTTVGDDLLLLARKHIAQAIELDSTLVRAQLGLVTISNMYLQQQLTSNKKNYDEFEVTVTKELIKYGAELVLASYKGTVLYTTMNSLMNEYTEGL
jgi:ER membrane protein complex subunit 2